MKIKKYALFILILIMLIGLFGFVSGVGAEGTGDEETFEETPGVAAQIICNASTGFEKVICQANQILQSIIPVLIALGILYFVWGVVSYMIGGDEEAKKKGRDKIIYGIIGLAAIIGMWGLVNIIVTTFDLGGQTPNINYVTSTLNNANTGPDCTLPNTGAKLQDVLKYATCTISNFIIPLMFAVATVMFVWGVVQYVINSDDEAKKTKGKNFMIWGIIALAVMVSVWGLVSILGKTFGVNTVLIPQVQQVQQ